MSSDLLPKVIGQHLFLCRCGVPIASLKLTTWLCLLIHTHRPSLGKYDDVSKWKHSPCYWPFVRGIHWWLVNSHHKGQWRGALMLFYLCPKKRLNKQSRCQWFEMPSCSLWCHCNVHQQHVCFSTATKQLYEQFCLSVHLFIWLHRWSLGIYD